MNTEIISCEGEGMGLLDRIFSAIFGALKKLAKEIKMLMDAIWTNGRETIRQMKKFLRTRAGKVANAFFSVATGVFVADFIYNIFVAVAFYQMVKLIAIVGAGLIVTMLMAFIGWWLGAIAKVGIGLVPLSVGVSGKAAGAWLFGGAGLSAFCGLGSKIAAGTGLFGSTSLFGGAASVLGLATKLTLGAKLCLGAKAILGIATVSPFAPVAAVLGGIGAACAVAYSIRKWVSSDEEVQD